MAHPQGGSSSTVKAVKAVSRSNWNLGMLVFEERENQEYPEKTSRSEEENQQKTQPTSDAKFLDSNQGHIVEASALVTAPSLFPSKSSSLLLGSIFYDMEVVLTGSA